MHAIMETIFDIGYLITVISVGAMMVVKAKDSKQYRLFGIMAVVLGCGDAFHLIPRVIALCTTGLDDYTVFLGIGKLVTSVTMTVFYVMMYHFWRMHYQIEDRKNLTSVVYVLAITRVALCLFPQNAWTSADAPLSWGIYRNIPFLILGLIVIYLFFKSSGDNKDADFKNMWLAILLSFAFYIPVVLWAHIHPMIGMLMLPKTCMYLWAVFMGRNSMMKRIK